MSKQEEAERLGRVPIQEQASALTIRETIYAPYDSG